MKNINFEPIKPIQNNEEFEVIEDDDKVSYICDHCGKEIVHKAWDPEYIPIKCPECGELQKVELYGTNDITNDQISKEFGKYSYCSHCKELTLNVEGKEYNNKFFTDYTEEDFKDKASWKYDPTYVEQHKKYLNNEITLEEWSEQCKIFKKTPPTIQQLAENFFICKECGKEKFWGWSYHCPKCDCDEYYFISMTDSTYNYGKAMEYGGNPQDWTETWMCKCCGHIYDIENSNC